MGGGEVSEMRGNGGEGQNLYGRACREHPTTLTASWWAGYSGREGGAWQRRPNRAAGRGKPRRGWVRHKTPLFGLDLGWQVIFRPGENCYRPKNVESWPSRQV